MKIAIVGCGYVADLYLQTLRLHPELELVGVFDRDARRLSQFALHYNCQTIPSMDELVCSKAELILNLTNPQSHFEVSEKCLLAGKHVYSEKPLAMLWTDALRLAALADQKRLLLASAPCSILGEAAQTLWKAVRSQSLGKVFAVYAEMDDGLVHRMPYTSWKSASGAPWPAANEFAVGCTLEHAGYVLSWLCAIFGPAIQVTAFGSETIPNKLHGQNSCPTAPDLTVAAIEFQSGVAARLTCSIVGEHDHRLRIHCEDGIIGVDDTWFYRSPVWLRKYVTIRRKTFLSPWRRKVPLCRSKLQLIRYGGSSCMDFCRGPAEMASALREGRPCRLSNAFSLHVNELTLAISNATTAGLTRELETTFPPMEPMPWAR